METLLVHAAVAPAFLPMAAARLGEAGVELRADERARILVPDAVPATAADWDTEYLDYVLAVKVVTTFEDAIAHIRRHGSGLAEAIVTRDIRRARRFTQEVDAAAVLGECLHAAGGWLGVRHGRRDGDLDLQAPRARPGRRARADDDQVRRVGRRAPA